MIGGSGSRQDSEDRFPSMTFKDLTLGTAQAGLNPNMITIAECHGTGACRSHRLFFPWGLEDGQYASAPAKLVVVGEIV